MPTKHPTYAINLKERPDRLAHIQTEFNNKHEFDLHIISAKRHKNGALGLWQNIIKVIKKAQNTNHEYVIICEDDHQFTKSYSAKKLNKYLIQAQQKNADVIMGGVSWFNSGLQVADNLFWVDKFSGFQFAIIFKKLFNDILSAKFETTDAADYKISELTTNKLVIYPFISVQKEFGYSDVTSKNNAKGRVNKLFKSTKAILSQMVKVKKYYNAIPNSEILPEAEYESISIPTYIINLPERTECLAHIKKQFKDKPELDVTIIEACKHEIGAVGLWQSIRKIINLAIQNDDDVIVICEDDHEFTSNYKKEFLVRNIIEANQQGADTLSVGASNFGQAIPITAERYWVNPLPLSSFIIIYSKFFERILNYEFQQKDNIDKVFSVLTSNKMALYPFISKQKGLENSVSSSTIHNNKEVSFFFNAPNQLKVIQQAYLKFLQP